jgi:hypothetical protein
MKKGPKTTEPSKIHRNEKKARMILKAFKIFRWPSGIVERKIANGIRRTAASRLIRKESPMVRNVEFEPTRTAS